MQRKREANQTENELIDCNENTCPFHLSTSTSTRGRWSLHSFVCSMQFCKLINISVYTTFRANAFQWREKQKITLISIEKLKIHLFSVLLFCFVWFWCVFKAQFEIKFSHFSLHHTLSHTQNSTFDDVYFTCRLKLFVKSTEKMLIKTWRKHQNLITIFTCRIFILISPFHYFTLKSSMISYMFFPVANGRKQQRHFVQLHYCLLNSLFCCHFFGLITLVYRVVVLVYSPRALQSIYGMMHESYKTLLQLLKKIIINLICFDYNFWFFSSLPSKNSLKRLWISCSKNWSKKKNCFCFQFGSHQATMASFWMPTFGFSVGDDGSDNTPFPFE